MPKEASREFSTNAFQVWMGQWRLTTLDAEGCLFVLRFLLSTFRSRRPDDRFWKYLQEFLCEQKEESESLAAGPFALTSKDLLTHAAALDPEQAGALVTYLSQCYAIENDRLFWSTVSEAIQLYAVAPYPTRSAGTA
jgi:hypothetical protein